ncbi:MAG: hypothetical protein QJR03_10085 [Sphaerobacter sp.]|nr:hypothetical protein [Sphaerobacter sp.]
MALNGGRGPYLLVAAICQRAQQDQYGSFSLINLLEHLVAGSDDPNAPEQMPPFRLDANLVVMFASGDTVGERMVTIVAEQPDGERLPPVSQRIVLRGNDQRSTIVSNLSLDIAQTGVYWFDVYLDDDLVTRIPLRIGWERGPRQPWMDLIR